MSLWQGENNNSVDIKHSNPILSADSNNQLHSNRYERKQNLEKKSLALMFIPLNVQYLHLDDLPPSDWNGLNGKLERVQ